MCGRLAWLGMVFLSALQPEEVCNSCCYKKKGYETLLTPIWKDFTNSKKTYSPSYNICPQEIAPVLLSGSHFNSCSRIIAPMYFGLRPLWKTGNKHPVINCRIESISTSKLFRTPFLNRQRCVVICNGFYEWQKKNNNCSTPFFIYHEQPKDVLIDDPDTWNLKVTKEEGLKSFKVLKLAAIFHKQNFENDVLVYSFTIITKEASSKMSWLHPRMPVFVDTEEQLDVWLNSDDYDTSQALRNLSQDENIIYYSVSSSVNRTGNKDISCIKQNKRREECERNGVNVLKVWLQSQKRKTDERDQETNKKIKEM